MSAVIDPCKRYPCKEGTVPALVYLKPGTVWPLAVGAKVSYRRHEGGSHVPWQTGVVTRTNADGYFFMDRH